MNIDFIENNYQNFDSDLKSLVERALEEVLEVENVVNATVDIEFLPPQTVKKINKIFRGIDRTTDVLSFPLYNTLDEIRTHDVTFPIHLGDIIINPERARQQAEEYGNSFNREVLYLCIHSLLHLLGYDHIDAEDKREMRSREKMILKRLEK